MNTNILLNWLFIISLAAASLSGLFAVACLPLGIFKLGRHQNHKLLHLSGTLFGLMIFFAVICGVLWFTALNADKPL